MVLGLLGRGAAIAAKAILKKKAKKQATKATQKQFEATAKKHGARGDKDNKERYADAMDPHRAVRGEKPAMRDRAMTSKGKSQASKKGVKMSSTEKKLIGAAAALGGAHGARKREKK